MKAQKPLETLQHELNKVLDKIAVIERKQNGGYTAEVAKAFPLGMVGGSGRNTRTLNKRRANELDKTIDLAVAVTELRKQAGTLERQINDITSGAVEKRQEQKQSRDQLLAEYWRNLKPGDLLEVGNPNGKTVITKKSLKSCSTGSGSRSTAAEIIGKEAAALL